MRSVFEVTSIVVQRAVTTSVSMMTITRAEPRSSGREPGSFGRGVRRCLRAIMVVPFEPRLLSGGEQVERLGLDGAGRADPAALEVDRDDEPPLRAEAGEVVREIGAVEDEVVLGVGRIRRRGREVT